VEEGVVQKTIVLLLVSLFPVLLAHTGAAADSAEVEALKKQVQSLQRTVEQLQQTIGTMQKESQENVVRDQQLRQQVEAVQKRQTEALQARVESPLDQAVRELEQEQPQRVGGDLWSRQVGGVNLRLLDLSLAAAFYAGGSTERDAAIQTLQAGGHDPRKRGFTLAEAELGFVGAVDPYFYGQAFISTSIDPIDGETIVELEEAYITTTSLPYALQAKLGFFYTEFGIINPQHPHQWDWEDQPIVNNRFFGPDGMRQAGFRLSKLLPTPWFSELHLGMQNANGETMTSFLGGRHEHGGGHEEENGHDHAAAHDHSSAFSDEGIGNRPIVERDVRNLKDFVYLTRWRNSWDFNPELTTAIGVSGLYGPNASGKRGDTWIYGLDMKTKWRPANNFRGWPFLIWQTEFMRRDFKADRFTLSDEEEPDTALTIPGRTLHDWGLYTQLLYGFHYGWAAGVRYEYASGSTQSIGGRKNDPFRANRQRVSPLLVYHPTEFSRIRLQYNYDHGNFLVNSTKNAHSVWLGFEWLYGAHAAHEY
jgi:hypothetical protein